MRHARQKGHTIMELLVVMAVLGILATAAMPLIELSARRNKERELKEAVWEIRHAIDAYKAATDAGRVAKMIGTTGYPPSLSVLAAGVADSASGGTSYWLRRIPRDPFAPATTPAIESWGLRSYASSADAPKAGGDVFDVHSKSQEVGMNGVPYRQW